MTRAEAAAILGAELATPLADAGMVATDSTGNLKEPLDRALRALGYGAAELAGAEPADDAGFLALATWEALRTVWRRMSDRFDLGLSGTSLRLSQSVATVQAMLAEAEGEVVRWFGSVPAGVGGDGAGGLVALGLNYLEAGR